MPSGDGAISKQSVGEESQSFHVDFVSVLVPLRWGDTRPRGDGKYGYLGAA